MPKRVPKIIIPLPAGVALGAMLRYYSNGWRTGRLEKVKGNDMGIRPVGTQLYKDAHLKWINVSDVEALDKPKTTNQSI